VRTPKVALKSDYDSNSDSETDSGSDDAGDDDPESQRENSWKDIFNYFVDMEDNIWDNLKREGIRVVRNGAVGLPWKLSGVSLEDV
jgi:hypothetical protein